MRLQVHFDFGSPYSYLAWQRIRGQPAYAAVDIQWIAVSAGHIFKMDGTAPNASYPNQARYMWRDVQRYAQRYQVPFAPPTDGPGAMATHSIAASRMHFLAESRGRAAAWREGVFLAYFAHGRDISSLEVLDDLAGAVGLPGAQASQETEWKQALIDATYGAYEKGAPGVPFFVLEDDDGQDLFWGNDRLDWVEERLGATSGSVQPNSARPPRR